MKKTFLGLVLSVILLPQMGLAVVADNFSCRLKIVDGDTGKVVLDEWTDVHNLSREEIPSTSLPGPQIVTRAIDSKYGNVDVPNDTLSYDVTFEYSHMIFVDTSGKTAAYQAADGCSFVTVCRRSEGSCTKNACVAPSSQNRKWIHTQMANGIPVFNTSELIPLKYKNSRDDTIEYSCGFNKTLP